MAVSTGSVIACLKNIQASQLGNKRNIYVYLPSGYEEQIERHYPVLYVHAGQRAFGPSSPGNETWRLDLTADELISAGRIEPIIIVAIAHVRPVTRNEFYHYVDAEQEAIGIGGSGIEYEQFIIDELKPMIDQRYRTKRDRDNTGLLGSSAAALCTLHIGMRHPNVFGKLIMMSPYFVDAQLDEQAENGLREKNMYRLPDSIPDVNMWVDIGDTEGLFLPEQVRRVVQKMLDRGADAKSWLTSNRQTLAIRKRIGEHEYISPVVHVRPRRATDFIRAVWQRCHRTRRWNAGKGSGAAPV